MSLAHWELDGWNHRRKQQAAKENGHPLSEYPQPVFKGSPNLIFLAMKSSDSDERSQIPRQTRHQIEGLTRHVWRNCSSRPFSFVTRRTTQAFEMPRFSVRKIRFSQPLKTGLGSGNPLRFRDVGKRQAKCFDSPTHST